MLVGDAPAGAVLGRVGWLAADEGGTTGKTVWRGPRSGTAISESLRCLAAVGWGGGEGEERDARMCAHDCVRAREDTEARKRIMDRRTGHALGCGRRLPER